jgi:hypothetical protein
MGMPNVIFRCQMFRGDWDQIWSQMRMLWLMEGLVRVNQTHLRQFDEFKKRGLVPYGYPPVYGAGLHYETEKGTEIWPDIPSLLMGTMGKGLYDGAWGDCEDFACYRVAELRELPWHYERTAPWRPKNSDGSRNIECADPRFPQGDAERAASAKKMPWPGWKRVNGGVRAKPFAKWRRGPQGNYHYHALVYLPDGRLEDPSLVLGMGREKEFSELKMAEKLKNAEVPVVIQFAKAPEVMVVDPEKPSGYNGGVAVKLDKKVLELMAKRNDLTSGNDPEIGAYLTNSILLGDGEFDVDAVIGWSRNEKRFVVRSEDAETRRLLGYARH